MGAIDYDAISSLLKLNDPLKLLCVVALGYPAETPQETTVSDGDIRYYIGENGSLQVPKRALDDDLIKTV